jgi:hypothetical protein
MTEDEARRPKDNRATTRSDEEIGRAIVEASRALNQALVDACLAKLEIEIDVADHAEPGLTWKAVNVHVWRKIAIA